MITEPDDEVVERHADLSTVNQTMLWDLLSRAFGLVLVANYFETRKFLRVYTHMGEHTRVLRATTRPSVARHLIVTGWNAVYLGATVVTEEANIAYLDKFAVDPKHSGNGIARQMWEVMRADHHKLFWRARRSNPFNAWYERHADGSDDSDPNWIVYWYGLGHDEVERCARRAREIPSSFLPSPSYGGR